MLSSLRGFASLVPGPARARWAWSRHGTTRHAPGMIVSCLGLESGTVAQYGTARHGSSAVPSVPCRGGLVPCSAVPAHLENYNYGCSTAREMVLGRDENFTDIFLPYSRPNPSRGVQICPYPSTDIQHPIPYPYPNTQITYL